MALPKVLFAKPKTEMMLKIQLTSAEEMISAQVGLLRAEHCKKNNMKNTFERKVGQNYFNDILMHTNGIAAEFAIAKALGITDFKPTINTFKSRADILKDIEVKSTGWHGGHLIIHPKDRDTDKAVLVVGQSPDLFVAGWMPVVVAKRPRYRNNKTESWWVSQINLQPIESFLKSNYGNVRI